MKSPITDPTTVPGFHYTQTEIFKLFESYVYLTFAVSDLNNHCNFLAWVVCSSGVCLFGSLNVHVQNHRPPCHLGREKMAVNNSNHSKFYQFQFLTLPGFNSTCELRDCHFELSVWRNEGNLIFDLFGCLFIPVLEPENECWKRFTHIWRKWPCWYRFFKLWRIPKI
jgi:hypothetical protein